MRFAGSIYPGETIETSVWQDGNAGGERSDGGSTLTLLATCPERDGRPVLTHATMEVRS